MTNYYIQKNNDIILYDTNRQQLENTIAFMPQFRDIPIKETERPIEFNNCSNTYVFADTPEQQINKLEQLKTEKISQVNYAKEEAFKKGIIFKNAHFDCDDRAQDRTGNRLLLLQARPVETLEWLDYNYQAIELTATEFQQLCSAIFERIQFIEFKTGQFLESITSCTNIEELKNIKIDFTEEQAEREETNE